MPRIRYLKPEFFTDENLADLKYETRLTYAGLWCNADKAGRLEDRPRYLKAVIFPYDDIDMENQLDLLSQCKNGRDCPFIQRYEVEGLKLIQILKWEKHQKPHHTERDSVFPPAPPFLNIKIKGMEKQINPSTELRNGSITVKISKPLDQHEIFWKNYPKRKNKGDSEKAWLKLKPSLELQQKITQKVNLLKKSEDWLKEDGKYIPYPATWLNRKGWEDDVIVKVKTKHAHNSELCSQCKKEPWTRNYLCDSCHIHIHGF